jgi:glycosyltransferase involved in cell wall biosynthesis
MNEKISVIIPCYNSAKTIIKCLDSVFNQTYKNLEVIIVDDGSTDNLVGLLTGYNNKLIILQQENKGAPTARNYGFKISRGEFVIFLDADIVMRPIMLEKMFFALKDNPQASFAYSSFRFGWKNFRLWSFDSEKLKEMPYIHTSSLMRREAFPGFDPLLKKFQDWDLFLTIVERGGRGVFIPEVLFKVKTGGTISSWLPSFVYNFPNLKFKAQKKYYQGQEIIRKKHNL